MNRRCALAFVVTLFAAAGLRAQPLTTAFTYQGELRNSGSPVSGLYDLRFRLYDSPAAGTQIGTTLCADNISLVNGRFTVQLDFGGQFSGQQRFLEIELRQDTGLDCSISAGFVLLTPRQALTAAPNADFALVAAAAASATNTTQLNGQPATFYQNAANLSTGTIPSARISGIYGNVVNLSNPSNTYSGSGTGLTSLNASNLSTGLISDSLLSSNIPRLNSSNAFSGATNSFIGNVGIGTASPGMKLTVAGDMELGTGSGDYRRFRIGGGNSDGFLYGSFPAFGDGIHMGYNFYANSAGTPILIHPDGGTSRITTGYGYMAFATGGIGQPPVNRVDIDQNGTLHILNSVGNFDAASYYADPPPSGQWPQGTYPPGTPFNSAGAIALYAPAGSVRFGVRSRYNPGFSVFPNQGELYMDDSTGTDRVNIYLAGESGATSGNMVLTNLLCTGSKSFITPRPEHPEQDIIYYCLEGPENGIYLRGTSHLIAGRAHVDLPDTFSSVASKEGLTVILTPLSLDSRGLACINRSINGFDVGELLQGSGAYDFDWEVKAVRRGMRDKPVVVPWTEYAQGQKSRASLWKQRTDDIQRITDKFEAEDRELGPRP